MYRSENEMHKIYLIINCIVLLLLIGFGIGFSVQTYKLGYTREQLEHCRNELAAATDRQQSITNTVAECMETARRTSEILNKSATTIADIRKQIEEIRTSYESMESRLRYLSSIYGDTNNTIIYGENK